MTDVAFMLPSASGGGAERATIMVANRFAAEGYAVDLVMSRKGGAFLSDIAPDVAQIDLASPSIRRAFPAFLRYSRSRRPRLLFSPLVGTDLLALLTKPFRPKEQRLHISIQNSPSASKGESTDPLERNWPTLIKALYRHCDSMSGISSGLAEDVEQILKLQPGAVPVIHNPVDVAAADVRAAEPPVHPWLKDKSSKVVLAVGRLVKQKDFASLLQAFSGVTAQTPARLLILGDGYQRSELEALARQLGIAERVSMPGFSDNPFSAMANCDVFVLSSRWEGFANVVAEALACGTRVVSTDCPSGPGEILLGGKFGRLVPVGDHLALTQAILEALASPHDGEAGKARASNFSIDNVFDQYRRLFTSKGFI